MINFDEIKEVGINSLNGGNGVTKANMYMDNNIKIMKSVLERKIDRFYVYNKVKLL